MTVATRAEASVSDATDARANAGDGEVRTGRIYLWTARRARGRERTRGVESSSEVSFLDHINGAAYEKTAGFKGFAGLVPNKVGLIPTLKDPALCAAAEAHASGRAPLPPPRVAIVGGGIGGAATAHFLLELRPDVEIDVFEASSQPGGRAHTLGRNNHGQLGTGTTKARVRSPKEVKSLDGGALFVSAGAQHTVALGADKQLYAWGTASQSKGGGSCLGMGAGTTSVDEPEPIYDPD